MTPRFFVGALLLVLGFLVLHGMPGIHTQSATFGRFVLVAILAFIGTQVLIGKRLPGIKKRQRQ